ncbi:MAG: UTP--glucose-phosphate uridylyltransferase [Actinomycetota bacterium]|jgi:UTP--glucose-1-phosphate uridylyltransferase|nr:UTP--glucose-phosphate uridylyltransferase [Actinomycetota bacterium]
MSVVRKAVIPAAGLGTRFLPASKAIPKEMIPVVDKPGIQYAVEEAVRAGIEQIVVITSSGKGSIEEHFQRAPEFETHLEAAGKRDALSAVRHVSSLAKIEYVLQTEPLGFGHAVLTAAEFVGDDAFAVIVPDEIVPEPIGDEPDLLKALIDIHDRFDASALAVQQVPHEDISSYGVIDPEEVGDRTYRIKDMVEKPPRDEAPSDLAARGRYVFNPQLFDALRVTERGVGGEIQLTDGIRLLMKEQDVYAYSHPGPIYDVGKKLDYLKASIELALRRDDLAKPLRDFLVKRVAEL